MINRQHVWSLGGSRWRRTALIGVLTVGTAAAQTGDPLPSWNSGPTKQAIVDFVKRVTTPDGKDFVPLPERIATFDNDGTLGAEQPSYLQIAFALDRVKALAPQHPEWQTTEPFASLLRGDLKSALAGGENAILGIVIATYAGLTTEEWERIVSGWLATARHPMSGRPSAVMAYPPMLELLAYLRANGFKTYIVPGGSGDLVRPGPADVNERDAIVHIQVAVLLPQSVRDSSRSRSRSRLCERSMARSPGFSRRRVCVESHPDTDLPRAARMRSKASDRGHAGRLVRRLVELVERKTRHENGQIQLISSSNEPDVAIALAHSSTPWLPLSRNIGETRST